MGIVNEKEVAKGLNLHKLGFLGTVLGGFIMNITKLYTLNDIYDARKNLRGIAFLDAIIDDLGIEFEIPEKDLKRIPKTGAFITVSNHPLGGNDGIVLLKLLLESRPDYKIIANFLLHRLDPLKPYVIPVNPFENRKELKSNREGIREAISHIQQGHPMGVFPAGEVSTIKENGSIVDKPWSPEIMKLVQRSQVPVVPIYFHARNSPAFYRLAKLGDNFRTAKLPSELLNQRHRKIKVRIGNPISVKDQNEYPNLGVYTTFFRKKTYMLASAFQKKKD